MALLHIMERRAEGDGEPYFFGVVSSNDGEARLHATRITETEAEAVCLAEGWAEENDLLLRRADRPRHVLSVPEAEALDELRGEAL